MNDKSYSCIGHWPFSHPKQPGFLSSCYTGARERKKPLRIYCEHVLSIHSHSPLVPDTLLTLFENPTITEDTKHFLLSHLLSLTISLSSLPKPLFPVIRTIAQQRGFVDGPVLTLASFLPMIQLRSLTDALKRSFQIASNAQQLRMMNAVRIAALTLYVVLRRESIAELNVALKLYERLMESLAVITVVNGSGSAGVPLLYISYLSLQIWMQRKPRNLIFPEEKTVALLVSLRDITVLDGLSEFVKK